MVRAYSLDPRERVVWGCCGGCEFLAAFRCDRLNSKWLYRRSLAEAGGQAFPRRHPNGAIAQERQPYNAYQSPCAAKPLMAKKVWS